MHRVNSILAWQRKKGEIVRQEQEVDEPPSKRKCKRSLPSNVAREKCQRGRKLNRQSAQWQALQPGCSSPQGPYEGMMHLILTEEKHQIEELKINIGLEEFEADLDRAEFTRWKNEFRFFVKNIKEKGTDLARFWLS